MKKENKEMTLDNFIKIINQLQRSLKERRKVGIRYIRMTNEFYNHLLSQMKYINIKQGFEINHILGITIYKVPNGKLRTMPRMGKDDYEIEYGVKWA